MNLLDIIAKRIRSIKEALDLEPPSLTGQLFEIKNQLMKVQERLNESRALSREKDALIAELKAAITAKGDMVLQESAYYVQKGGEIVDGPFCSCCTDRDRKNIHLMPASKPKDQTGRLMDWVQCPQCQMPFRSKQAGECLKAHKTESTQSQTTKKQTIAKADKKATPKKTTPSRTRAAKKDTSAKTKAAAKPKRTSQTRTTKRASASKSKPMSSSR